MYIMFFSRLSSRAAISGYLQAWRASGRLNRGEICLPEMMNTL